MNYILFIILFSTVLFSQTDDVTDLNSTVLPLDSIPVASSSDSLQPQPDSTLFNSSSDSTLLAPADSLTSPSIDSSLLPQQAFNNQLDTVYASDIHRFSIYIQAGFQFIDFDDRDRFSKELERTKEALTVVENGATRTVTIEDSFEPVNFTVPIYLGLSAKLTQSISLSAGVGYYTKTREISILSRENEDAQTFEYSLNAYPLFLEYRHVISENIFNINNNRNFNISVRWFWFLSESSIESHNKPVSRVLDDLQRDTAMSHINLTNLDKPRIIHSDFSPLGNGGGIYLGYTFGEWQNISLEGDIGINFVKLNSSSNWSDLLPLTQSPTKEVLKKSTYSEPKASWNFGGVAMNIKFAWYFGKMSQSETTRVKSLSTMVTPASSPHRTTTIE